MAKPSVFSRFRSSKAQPRLPKNNVWLRKKSFVSSFDPAPQNLNLRHTVARTYSGSAYTLSAAMYQSESDVFAWRQWPAGPCDFLRKQTTLLNLDTLLLGTSQVERTA
jgi:hypothetical protein